jgi:hypothetical protein
MSIGELLLRGRSWALLALSAPVDMADSLLNTSGLWLLHTAAAAAAAAAA